jgi:chromosome segregation ATPase
MFNRKNPVVSQVQTGAKSLDFIQEKKLDNCNVPRSELISAEGFEITADGDLGHSDWPKKRSFIPVMKRKSYKTREKLSVGVPSGQPKQKSTLDKIKTESFTLEENESCRENEDEDGGFLERSLLVNDRELEDIQEGVNVLRNELETSIKENEQLAKMLHSANISNDAYISRYKILESSLSDSLQANKKIASDSDHLNQKIRELEASLKKTEIRMQEQRNAEEMEIISLNEQIITLEKNVIDKNNQITSIFKEAENTSNDQQRLISTLEIQLNESRKVIKNLQSDLKVERTLRETYHDNLVSQKSDFEGKLSSSNCALKVKENLLKELQDKMDTFGQKYSTEKSGFDAIKDQNAALAQNVACLRESISNDDTIIVFEA